MIEVENDEAGELSALDDLVDALNEAEGGEAYDYIETGVTGTDFIRSGIVYRPALVTPVGDVAVLDDLAFTLPPGGSDNQKNRPVVAQTFADANGAFTVAVVHLRSKGGSCGDGNDDPLQGACNGTRTVAARELVRWLAGDPTGSGDADVLVVGDFNAYDEEDPIDAFRAGADGELGTDDDYVDLVERDQGEFAYGYLFGAEFGTLDYAFASPPARRAGDGHDRLAHQRRRAGPPRLRHDLQRPRLLRADPVPGLGPRPRPRRPRARRRRRRGHGVLDGYAARVRRLRRRRRRPDVRRVRRAPERGGRPGRPLDVLVRRVQPVHRARDLLGEPGGRDRRPARLRDPERRRRPPGRRHPGRAGRVRARRGGRPRRHAGRGRLGPRRRGGRLLQTRTASSAAAGSAPAPPAAPAPQTTSPPSSRPSAPTSRPSSR